MAGNNSVVGMETVTFTDNMSFDGTERGGAMTTNGQLWIGSTIARHVRLGSIVSPTGTISIGYSAPNITLDVTGGSLPIEQITLDGGQIIMPSGSPLDINFSGNIVATSTHPKALYFNKTSGNSATLDLQVASAIASTDITKIGLAAFNSSQFTVDANGFVAVNGAAIGETITGDSGGALSPTSGNWNILGRSGSKTSGSGSTLTVKSPPFSQVGSSATSSLNTGEFVTAAVTRTLPASAGLADGDLFIYVCTTAGALVVQSVSAQKIRIGSLISSAAGTATSTNIGDSLTLRFNGTDGFFYAVSVIGTWVLA